MAVGGDIILRVQGITVGTRTAYEWMQQVLSQLPPGAQVTLTVLREGRQILSWGKNILRLGYIGVLLGVLTLSCARESYEFIGTWSREPRALTYVNRDRHIKLTFPNGRWRVYTRPHKDLEPMTWNRPGWPQKEDRSYHVLIARIPDLAMLFQIQIDERTTDISLSEYGALAKESLLLKLGKSKTIDFVVLDSRVTQQGGRRILVVTYKMIGEKALNVVLKEGGRFIAFSFSTIDSLFESKKGEFWSIVASYEHLE